MIVRVRAEGQYYIRVNIVLGPYKYNPIATSKFVAEILLQIGDLKGSLKPRLLSSDKDEAVTAKNISLTIASTVGFQRVAQIGIPLRFLLTKPAEAIQGAMAKVKMALALNHSYTRPKRTGTPPEKRPDEAEPPSALQSAIDELYDSDAAETQPIVVDVDTDLVLPPPAKKPYRERGHHPDGRRLNVLEHLQEEYGPYIEAGLLFSGHIQEIDNPAYQALLYLAEKEAKALGQKRGSNTAEFCHRHGILTGEHLSNPPPGRERQIQLIKSLHARKIEQGLLYRARST